MLVVVLLTLPEERPTRERDGRSSCSASLGVLVVLGAWRGFGGGELGATPLPRGRSVLYGIGFPYVRRNLTGRGSALSLAAAQLGLCERCSSRSSLRSLDGAPGSAAARACSLRSRASAPPGSGIAYLLNYSIIRDAGATVGLHRDLPRTRLRDGRRRRSCSASG